MRLHCNSCQTDVEVETVPAAVCPQCGRTFDRTLGSVPRTDGPVPKPTDTEHPERFGRYRVTGLLGVGTYGVVFRGVDDELRRDVAIKVPKPTMVATNADIEAFLAEARVLARLDHPHIVPVHDVGRTDDGNCYVVSKFVSGGDLEGLIARDRPGFSDAVALMIQVADALQHAHARGLVHRDIKPGNLLLDGEGKLVIADFGLALRDEDFGRGPGFAGTPAYMSPEQARGEGHRVDARSDLFSFGVVFYELLAGRRPFTGETMFDVLEAIANFEPPPTRQFDANVPRELDRIALKCLSKRASDRYSNAAELGEDLRYWRDATGIVVDPLPHFAASILARDVSIIPKGLRSFDAGDAGFFLALLPGPHDRDGLPESLRFWKTRIEQLNPASSFSVGLLFGPSGCGKSSLVKAGLLPRLAAHVVVVYVESTPHDTEARLLRGLREVLPELPDDISLTDALSGLRRGRWLPAGQKVLLVLDQFEQWLHSHREEPDAELLQALRHADAARVQAILLVRDDFSMAAARFFRALDIPVVEGQNYAVVDRFDIRHARKVLALFGRAFDAIPADKPTADQAKFLDRAVAGLAEDGKVITVRLALFAEMWKAKSWTPAALDEVGGVAGVGETFLEESLGEVSHNPTRVLHAAACRAVLAALLPEEGSDIKGTMRDRAALAAAADYADRPGDFDEVLRILDAELRLITPIDAGTDDANVSFHGYQLTHDYLVPSLREWLTRKQRETKHGRAELMLQERTALWQTRRQDRLLPSLGEYLRIRRHTRRRDWSESQAALMRKAGRRHSVRTAIIAAMILVATFAGLYGYGAVRAQALVRSLATAATIDVPALVQELRPYHHWADRALRAAVENATTEKEQLHARLALLPGDAKQADPLAQAALAAAPAEVAIIATALLDHGTAVAPSLWSVANSPGESRERRLRAAAILTKIDREDGRWSTANPAVVADLLRENPVLVGAWVEQFRPVSEAFLPALSSSFRSGVSGDERSVATALLADYAADQPHLLADLLMDADEKQFSLLFPKLTNHGDRGLPMLIREIEIVLPPDAMDDAKEKLAKRQANAAVALLRMNQPTKVWPLLRHSSDPRVRSSLIHQLGPFGGDATAIANRLEQEPDVTIRRALLLSLGEFTQPELSKHVLKTLLPKLQEIYRTASDPGLHAAAEWLLRTSKQESWLKQINEEMAESKEQRASSTPDAAHWFVNGQGQTMVVIPGPVEFFMGSPPTEVGRNPNESRHKKRIGRSFAIAAKAVTLEQYRRFDAEYSGIDKWAPTADCPVLGISWFQAAAYCNWLSKHEGMPESEWCYEPRQNPNAMPTLAASTVGLLMEPSFGHGALSAACSIYPKRTEPEFVTGMKLTANYLTRRGYRLPTEAEMEYATRAGATTSRFYGETEDLLSKHAWYFKQLSQPVGSLKPNDFGLFDVQGNVFTWCQDRYRTFSSSTIVSEDREDALIVNGAETRVLRGGSFNDLASNVRSASRYNSVPSLRLTGFGFRLAKTQ